MGFDSITGATYAPNMTSAALRRQGVKLGKVTKLLRHWKARDAEYDARTWPRVKKIVEQNRLSVRKRFND